MTKANSSKAENTKMTQAPLQTSIALVYATGGKDRLTPAVWVDIVNRVVTPANELVPEFFFYFGKKKIKNKKVYIVLLSSFKYLQLQNFRTCLCFAELFAQIIGDFKSNN